MVIFICYYFILFYLLFIFIYFFIQAPLSTAFFRTCDLFIVYFGTLLWAWNSTQTTENVRMMMYTLGLFLIDCHLILNRPNRVFFISILGLCVTNVTTSMLLASITHGPFRGIYWAPLPWFGALHCYFNWNIFPEVDGGERQKQKQKTKNKKQNKTKQNKTKQNKTKQNKTKQNKKNQKKTKKQKQNKKKTIKKLLCSNLKYQQGMGCHWNVYNCALHPTFYFVCFVVGYEGVFSIPPFSCQKKCRINPKGEP